MDSFLQEHLEAYLEGRLHERELAEFERRLRNDAAAAEEMELFRNTSALFAAFQLDSSAELEPAPGFYTRVMDRVESERGGSFLAVLTQPFMVRRLAFAAMMWLLMLGSVAVFHDDTTAQSVHLANSILKQQQPEQYAVRMGYDLEQNRDSMLSVLIASAE